MNMQSPEISGIVLHGKRIGRDLGYPTANLAYSVRPNVADGVYLARVTLPDARVVHAVLNQGHHPTFIEGKPTIELHLLDFSEDLYGQQIKVTYLTYLRKEMTFPSAEALKAQISADISAARRLCSS